MVEVSESEVNAAFTSVENFSSIATDTELNRAGNMMKKTTSIAEANFHKAISASGHLAPHVCILYAVTPSEDEQSAEIQMQDLTGTMKDICAMALVMGSRTVTSDDLAQDAATPRPDLFALMEAANASALTAEEKAAGSVSQARYLSFVDACSSTSTLSFRIDAAKTARDGVSTPLPLPEGQALGTLRAEEHIIAAFTSYLQGAFVFR